MISVVVIDENPMFRQGLESLLAAQNISILADAQTGAAGAALINRHKPQVVLIHTRLPDMTGEALCRCLHRRHPALRMIFFLSPVHWPTLSRLVGTPAQGFLSKEAYYASAEAIKIVHAGKTYLQPDLALGLLNYRAQSPDCALKKLSIREHEVLALLTRGKTYEQISALIPLSVKTVYNLKTSACKKLAVQSREALARWFPA